MENFIYSSNFGPYSTTPISNHFQISVFPPKNAPAKNDRKYGVRSYEILPSVATTRTLLQLVQQ